MKAERTEPKQEFVPVIVTLESQEEVDALFTVGNSPLICNTLPALDRLYGILKPFTSNRNQREMLYNKLARILN